MTVAPAWRARTSGGGAFVKAVVEHGADDTVARPAGFTSVEWIGSVQPVNATADDTWINPADSTTADLTAHTADTSDVHGMSDTTKVKAVVNHGAAGGTARPVGFASVEWVGTATPTNATSADTWVNPNEAGAAVGPAGGDLTGTFPAPTLGDGKVTARKMAKIARPNGAFLPAGAKAQTIFGANGTSSSGAIASGQVQVAPILVAGGDTISSITFHSGTTALAGGSNQWFCLIDVATRNVLATTVDDTSAAWAATVPKTLLLATAVGGSTPGGTFTPAVGVELWVGVMVVATTMPTMSGHVLSTAGPASLPPVKGARTGTTLTNPASLPTTVVAPVFNAFAPYAHVS